MKSIRCVWLVMFVCLSAVGGTWAGNDCPTDAPTTLGCLFQGFFNTPVLSTLSRDDESHLVVCLDGLLGQEFGVFWALPFDRTGHEDWIDLGLAEWEPLDSPGSVNNAQMKFLSTGTYKFSGSTTEETITALMIDIGAEVAISTDFSPIGATMVEFELFANPGDAAPIATATVADPVANPAVASNWPISTEFGRYIFGSSTAVTLPGQMTMAGRELGIHPVAGSLGTLKGTSKVEASGKNVKQSSLSRAPDLCVSNNQFTLVQESLGSNPIGQFQVIPVLPAWGLALLVLLVAGTGVYLIGRGPAA